MHPRNRLTRATKNPQKDDDDVEFIKQRYLRILEIG